MKWSFHILQIGKLRLREIKKFARETRLVEPYSNSLIPEHMLGMSVSFSVLSCDPCP
jgi:hypothetical protein